MQISLQRLWQAGHIHKVWPDDQWHEVSIMRLMLEAFLFLWVTTLAVYMYSASVS